MVNINNLFKLISMKGITQSKLAEDTSVSTGNISDWKKGKSMPSAVKLDELATYFDCSVDYLLGRTDNPDGTGNNISQSNIAGNKNASINNASPAPVHDSVTDEFMKIFKELSFEDKAELMHSAAQMKKKED